MTHCGCMDGPNYPDPNCSVCRGSGRPRKGDWMQTFTGRQFWPIDPRADEVHIEDIAHALSMACRYAGHCKRFYSVAEHSVLVSWYLPVEIRLWGLLHDASEAYLVDVPRPLKPYLPGYYGLEASVMAAVCERFGLPTTMPARVKEIDNQILVDESQQNMAPCAVPWNLPWNPLGVTLKYWTPEQAEHEFLALFHSLTAPPRTPEDLAAWRAGRGEAVA